MAETTATVKPTTSVQAKKSSNIISLLAPYYVSLQAMLSGDLDWETLRILASR